MTINFLQSNRSKPGRAARYLAGLIAAAVLAGCSSTVELTSRWTNHEMKIDGTNAEWKDSTTLLAGPQVMVSMKNDKENVYLYMETSNRMTQIQMLALGMSVWFDSKGEKDKTFGIQFPVSGLLQGRRPPSQLSPDQLKRFIDVAQRQFEILGPGEGERHRFGAGQVKGIDVHLGYVDGSLIYELKVPLHKSTDHKYAIDADPMKPLFIGLETGDYAEAMGGQSGGSSRGSGGGRGGGRGGGGGSQTSGAPGGEIPEPLKHWLIVQLSASN